MQEYLYIKDCGGGGHCMFSVLAEGLNEWDTRHSHTMGFPKKTWTSDDMRNVLADAIGRGSQSLETLHAHSSLPRPPASLKGAPQSYYRKWLQDHVRTRASFWGEVQFLQDFYLDSPTFRQRQLGFLIVQPVRYKGDSTPRMLMMRCMDAHTRHVMLIYYQTNMHFQLLGCQTKNGKVHATFECVNQSPSSVVQFLLDTSDLKIKNKKLVRELCDRAR